MAHDTKKQEPRDLSLPIYRRIEKDLRGRIQNGGWRAGAMIPSRKDLSQEYGVDLGTVQRAVAGLLADGTLRADGGRGTFVTDQEGARQETAGDRGSHRGVKMIALILDQSFNPTDLGAQAMPRAIYHRLRAEETEYRLLTMDTHGEALEQIIELERDALEAAEREAMAGVILWHSGGEQTLPQIRRLLANGVPVIFMDRYPASLPCDFIGVDDEGSAREATGYLLSLGHRRIAFLAPLEPITTIEERLVGYQKALQDAGTPQAEELICRLPYTLSLNMMSLKQQVRTAAAALAALKDPPTAVFAVNDFLAHHYIAAAEEIGLSVPGTVSVMGFDDMERFSPRPPFLTTMHQPFEAMAERAVELLLRRLQALKAVPDVSQNNVFQHILLPTKLVVRHSCYALSQRL